MRWIRGPINAILVATLVKPIARRMIARWRRRAREYAETTIVIPAQGLLGSAEELLGSALAPEMVLAEPSLPAVDDEVIDELAGRSMMRAMFIAGALATLVAATVIAVAYVRRRRAETELQAEDATEQVAIPIEVPAEEPAEALSLE